MEVSGTSDSGSIPLGTTKKLKNPLFVKDIQRVLFFGLGISVVFRSFSEKNYTLLGFVIGGD
jgi:hypothetical protein